MKRILLLITCFQFAILSQAQHPTNLTSSNITSSSADLSWNSSMCSGNVNFKYRITGTGSSGWNQTNNVASPYILNNLSASTSYDWQVKCAGTGGWSSTAIFTTTNSPCNLVSSISVINASCNGIMDGSANVSVSGGTSPYTFSWDNGDTSQNLNGVLSGTYIINITDATGCTQSDTVTIGIIGINSVNQSVSEFSPNPLTNYGVWSYDTLELTNTGCDTRIRPEFIISSSAGAIQQGDFIIRWLNPFTNGWPEIPYNINSNGDAYGYWSTTSNTTNDSTGLQLSPLSTQEIVVRVKFFSQASYATYTAIWETVEVDNLGNNLGALAPQDTVSLYYVNCSSFSIDNIAGNNINCNGSNDGSASVINIVGGSGSYSYSWSNGSTNPTISSLSAGTYIVTVTDNLWGCSDSDTITITEPDPLSPNISATQITCNGANDGILNVSSNGGSGQIDVIWLSHPWLPPVPNQTNLLPGTYLIDIVDLVCGEVVSTSYTIIEPSIVSVSSSYSDNTSCDSLICNGSIQISSTGGTPPYSYIWSNGYTDSTRNDLCSNSYSININDINGCGNFTENITISDNISNNVTMSITSNNISCYGLNDGSAEAIIGGGTGSSGGNTSTLTYCASSPGTNGYNTIDQINLIGDGDAINNNTSGSCDAYEDYTSQYATLSPGSTYTLSIQLGSCHASNFFNPDSTGVFIDWNIDGDFDDINEKIDVIYTNVATTHNINITVPNIAYGPTRMRIISHSQINNPGFPDGPVGPCVVGDFGQNGTYNQPWYGATEDYSLVINGSVPAQYLWSTGDTTNIISNLSAGTYTVTVTDTNNCSSIDSVTITEPSDISIVVNTTNVSCNGGNDGSASLSISGGTPGYTENWFGANPNSLSAGSYSYIVTDTNGCTDSNSITINEPSLLSVTSSQIDVTCNGQNTGSSTLYISGGTQPYTVVAFGQNLNLPLGIDSVSTSTFSSGIPAGTYPYTVTDNNGCSFTSSVVITEPNAISVTSNTTNVSCNGLSDGTATLNLSGGTGNLTSNWGTANPSALSAGTYIYTITDGNGCTFTSSVTITEPSDISSVITTVNLSSCIIPNGSIDLTVNGGTSPYTYSWNTGDTSQDLSNLSAGYYEVVIHDSNQCSDTIGAAITQPSNNLNLTLSSSNYNGWEVSCDGSNNGVIYATGTGGSGSLTYTYNNMPAGDTITNLSAGIYSITVIDSVGCAFTKIITLLSPPEISSSGNTTNVSCNGLSDGTVTLNLSGGTGTLTSNWGTANPSALSAGTYIYTITDDNMCTHIDSITITEPDTISISKNIVNVDCNGNNTGSVILSISGGTPGYTENWLGADPNSLSAGSYSYIITDTNGCSNTGSVIITEPNILNTNETQTNVDCNGNNTGSVVLSISGGTQPYIENWMGAIPNALSAGSYSYIVTDINGCSNTGSVIITEPNPLIINLDTIIDVSSYNGNDGEIQISSIGGVINYSYIWSGPTGYSSTSEDITSLISGIYNVTLIDGNNCIATNSFFVDEPPSLSVNLDSSTDLLCFEQCNGALSITANGGDSTYSYLWIGPNGFTSTNEDIQNLCAGTYQVIVSDSSDSISAIFTINQPAELMSVINSDTAICYGGVAQTHVYIYGGTYPYNVLWDNNSTNYTTHLTSGIHYVYIEDANGCSKYDFVNVIENDPIIADVISNDVTCFGLSNGSSIINITSGGTPPYYYSLDSGQTYQSSNLFSNLSPGNYQYLIEDNNGCTQTTVVNINEPPLLAISLSSTPASCYNSCDGSASATISGGIAPYSWTWTDSISQTTNPAINLCSGVINVIVEDSNGCLSTASTLIIEPNPLIVNVSVNGDTLRASPGFASYQWFDQNQNPIIGATDSTYLSTSQGSYYVEVTDINGCSINSRVIDIIIESIDDVTQNISIYPNPTRGYITISNTEKIENDIDVINSLGKIITSIKKDEWNNNKTTINLSSYPKGIYIIQLINNNKIINHKIILQ